MKSVLAFGDSLTWGSDPQTGGRHPYQYRWPNVVQAGLGTGVDVITDAMRGRTTVFDDYSSQADRNGARALQSALYAHAPLDLVVIMLGSNDMQRHLAGCSLAATRGMRRLVEIIRSSEARIADHSAPDILIVAPTVLVETADEECSVLFRGLSDEFRMLAPRYRDLAGEMDCGFFDAATVAQASTVDGIHLDAHNTRALGQALAPVISLMLGL